MKNSLLLSMAIIFIYLSVGADAFSNHKSLINNNSGLSEKEPIFIIYERQSGINLRKNGRSKIPYFEIYADGKVIDHQNNRQFNITQKEIDTFFISLSNLGFFDDNKIKNRVWFGPDSNYVVIEAESNNNRKSLSSWHPLFEKDKNLVASSNGGITNRNSRSQEEIEKNWDADYKEFRKIWTAINRLVTALKN